MTVTRGLSSTLEEEEEEEEEEEAEEEEGIFKRSLIALVSDIFYYNLF
jgi:hypothetical protein